MSSPDIRPNSHVQEPGLVISRRQFLQLAGMFGLDALLVACA